MDNSFGGEVLLAIVTIVSSLVGVWALNARTKNKLINDAIDKARQADANEIQRIRNLQAQNDVLSLRLTEFEQLNKDLIGKIQSLVADTTRQQSSLDILEQAYQDVRDRAATLENRVAQLETENQVVKNQLNEKAAELDAVRERMHRAEVDRAEFKAAVEIYQTRYEELFALLKEKMKEF